MNNFPISPTAKRMAVAVGIFFAVFLAIGLAVIRWVYPFEGALPYALGLALGCALSVTKILLIERALNQCADMEGKQATSYAQFQYVLRLGLTLAVLAAVVVLRDVFGLFGAILGILSLQISAYAAKLFLKKD